MTKEFSLTLLVFGFSLLYCIYAFAQENNAPNANELLNHYVETCSKFKTISSRINCLSWTGDSRNPRETKHYETDITFRRNHKQTEWIGKTSFFDTNGIYDPERSRLVRTVVNGENIVYMTFYNPELDLKGGLHPRAYIRRKNFKKYQTDLLEYAANGGPMDGNIFGNNHRSIAELLSYASNLRITGDQEKVCGSSCYVLEAVTEHGKVTAWIAPNKGYNALKWIIHRTSGDFLDDKTLPEKGLKTSNSAFEATEVQEIDSQYVITKGFFTGTSVNQDGEKFVRNNEYKRTEVDLNPDFEALGAFQINLPEGTVVANDDIPCVKFIWSNGKLVPKPAVQEVEPGPETKSSYLSLFGSVIVILLIVTVISLLVLRQRQGNRYVEK